MNRRFTTIKANVGSNIQDTSSAMDTIIARLVNDVYKDVLRRVNHKNIDDDYSFTTTAGTRDYVLPDNFYKELMVFDDTNDNEIAFIDRQILIEKYGSTLNTNGTVQRYTILDWPCRQQPTAEETLGVVSSSASDTTQTVRIRGISDGVEMSEDVTLNGTSEQTTSNAYSKILGFSKSATTIGKVTIDNTTSSEVLAIIPPAGLDYKVKIMRLNEVPSSAITVLVPYIKKWYELSDDNDILEIDVADIVELGTTEQAWRYKRQFAKAQEMERKYEKAITQYVWDQENQPNQVRTFNVKPYSRETV